MVELLRVSDDDDDDGGVCAQRVVGEFLGEGGRGVGTHTQGTDGVDGQPVNICVTHDCDFKNYGIMERILQSWGGRRKKLVITEERWRTEDGGGRKFQAEMLVGVGGEQCYKVLPR